MRSKLQYHSRFKILKGGKIGLIISAVLSAVTLSFASPSGGVLSSGTATISQSGKITNINQSTNKASINWQSFGIQTDETVNFIQPNSSSITLNRVIGNEKSIIDGALNANGQVWILNSNGVLFGSNAKINTSGLLTTTKELSDTDFQNSNYSFTGDSSNSIINQGTITIQNNGYVILASNEVKNSGIIEVVKGKVHLIGANEYTLNLNGNSLVELTIDKGVLDALVENSGTIINNGGEVYLTTNAVDELLGGVVNHTGIIEANSLDGITGEVELYAHGGTVNIDGTIEAKDGFVETSGKNLSVADSFSIVADTWLLDPDNIVIEEGGGAIGNESVSATAIESALSGTTDVELQATYDITVNDDISWDEATKLTLTAGDEIYVNATIENTNATYGGVYFNAENAVIFDTTGKVIINNIYQLQWVNTALDGNYELGSDIDASVTKTDTTNWGTTGFDPIGDSSDAFIGSFDGNNYTIDSLYINRSSENYVGLFGTTGGTIANLGVTNVNITGNNYVGALSGNGSGTTTNVYSTGNVAGNSYVGGLIGIIRTSGVTNSYSSVNVTATGYYVGGLVGVLDYDTGADTLSDSYATGDVTGLEAVGGLVGSGSATNSYATGDVSGTSDIGGLVGEGDATNSYATGDVTAIGDYVGGLIGAGNGENSYATGDVSGDDYVGGLVGRGSATNSYATGDVSGTTYVGGLIGEVTDYITNAYATGNVSGSSYYIGGLVGEISGDITNAYSTGKVTGNSYVGGLIGYYNKGTIRSSYWDTETSGQDNGIGGGASSSELIGLSSEEFADLTYFSTWDSDIWQLGETYMEGYGLLSNPYLKNVTQESDIPSYTTLFESGWGTEESPYTISTWVDLANIAYNSETLSCYYDLINDLTTSTSGYSIYASSSANDGLGFDPIGDSSDAFIGSFDGNNYTIDSLYINRSSENYVGLFGTTGGTIANLGVTNVNITGNNYVGALSGNGSGTTTNVYSTGNVAGNSYVGGLIGIIRTSGVTNSYSSVNVTATGYYVGGLVGVLDYDTGADTLSDSYATGDVTGLEAVGGLVGSGSATNSYATGDVSGTSDIGGLVGEGDATNSYATGDVTAIGDYVGGLIGAGNGENSYATGDVSGDDYVGGLVGRGSATNSYATGDVSGTTYVGGLIGEVTDYITNAYATGNVSGSSYYIGGLVGEISGDITNAYSTGKVTGNSYVGGLIGYYNKGTIRSSYWDTETSGQDNGIGGGASSSELIGLSSEQMAYGKIFSDAGWGIEVDDTLTSGDAPVLRYNDDGTVTWIIAPLTLSYTLANQSWTYDGTTYLLTTFYNDSSIIFGDEYSFIDFTYFSFIDSSDSAISSLKNAGTYSIGLSTTNEFLNVATSSNTQGTITINPKELTLSTLPTAEDKVYDGSTTTSASNDGTLSGFIGSETVSFSVDEANFDNKNAGEDKTVTVTYSLSDGANGGLASNYTLSAQTTLASITAKEISATYSAEDKIYDGTTLADVTGTLSDIISGDDVTLSQSAKYEDKNVGTNKEVTISNIALSGDDASNYTLTSATTTNTTADITAKEVTVSYSAENKIYDGTTIATVSGVLGSGVISGDSVSILTQSAEFEDKNVGTNKEVTISDIALSGDDASNYTLTSATTVNTTADITAKEVTVSYSAEDKTYDGTTLAEVTGTLSDIISGDSVSIATQSAEFEDKNAGENKQVTIFDIALSGDDALNYIVSDTTTTANITPKSVTVSYSASDKTYDGTTIAQVNGKLNGVIGTDKVSLSQNANFIDTKPGENKLINIFNIVLYGADAQNYYLLSNSAIARANISNVDLSNALRGIYAQNMQKQDIAKKQLEGFNMGDFFNSLKNGSQLNLGFKGLVADELDKLFDKN